MLGTKFLYKLYFQKENSQTELLMKYTSYDDFSFSFTDMIKGVIGDMAEMKVVESYYSKLELALELGSDKID